jgi:hypothetical protein
VGGSLRIYYITAEGREAILACSNACCAACIFGCPLSAASIGGGGGDDAQAANSEQNASHNSGFFIILGPSCSVMEVLATRADLQSRGGVEHRDVRNRMADW